MYVFLCNKGKINRHDRLGGDIYNGKSVQTVCQQVKDKVQRKTNRKNRKTLKLTLKK